MDVEQAVTGRSCGDCQLCCKLVPVEEIGKPGNTRCRFQKSGKGCSIYEFKPDSCSHWSCAWLTGKDTENIKRPDKGHYIIDGYFTYMDLLIGDEEKQFKALQIWVDPKHKQAYQDAALFKYIMKYAERDIVSVIRYQASGGFVLLSPKITETDFWFRVWPPGGDYPNGHKEIFKVTFDKGD